MMEEFGKWLLLLLVVLVFIGLVAIAVALGGVITVLMYKLGTAVLFALGWLQ